MCDTYSVEALAISLICYTLRTRHLNRVKSTYDAGNVKGGDLEVIHASSTANKYMVGNSSVLYDRLFNPYPHEY